MTSPSAKLASLSAIVSKIDQRNRRQIVESALRPVLEDLRGDWNYFDMDRTRFMENVDTLGIWATQIAKSRDTGVHVDKFVSELIALESRLKRS